VTGAAAAAVSICSALSASRDLAVSSGLAVSLDLAADSASPDCVASARCTGLWWAGARSPVRSLRSGRAVGSGRAVFLALATSSMAERNSVPLSRGLDGAMAGLLTLSSRLPDVAGEFPLEAKFMDRRLLNPEQARLRHVRSSPSGNCLPLWR